MAQTALLRVDGKDVTLPVVIGSENEKAIDVRNLRTDSGCITFDDGYGNTGSCQSSITYIDGDTGILRYRGYPIEQLAEHSTFAETAYLILHGELPTPEQRKNFSINLTENAAIHSSMEHMFESFPADAHPMAILSAMLNAMSCYEPEMMEIDDDQTLERAAARIISKVRTVAAASYKMSVGQPLMYPRTDYK